MGFFSWAKSAISSVAKKVVSVAKTVASKAINFVANSTEKVIGGIKSVWKTVKPFVEKAQTPLVLLAAKFAATPVLGPILAGIAVGVKGLLALENSPILKKLEQVLLNVSKRAQKLEELIKNNQLSWILSAEEYEAALQNRAVLREAEADIAESERERFEVLTAVNDISLAMTDVEREIQGEPENFEHYLRLRAAQKLLQIQKGKLQQAGSLAGLSQEDWFQVHIAADLIKKDPELSEKAGERIDEILKKMYGKTLQSFVYEEIVSSWKVQGKTLADKLSALTHDLSAALVKKRRLESAKRIQESLDAQEAAELEHLENTIPILEVQKEKLQTQINDIETFSNATEGFLQLLEKEDEELIAEGREYILTEGEEVGRIVISAADGKLSFAALEPIQQKVVRHFANIFKKDANKRVENFVAVGAA